MYYDDEPSTLLRGGEEYGQAAVERVMQEFQHEQDELATRQAIQDMPKSERLTLVVHNPNLGKSNITDEDIRIVKELNHGKIWNR